MTVSPWAGRRVIVTGATGLLGGWLTRRLVRLGADVTAVVRDPSQAADILAGFEVTAGVVFEAADVTVPETLARVTAWRGAAAVFHLAGISLVSHAAESAREAFEVNAGGTWNVLEALRAADKPVMVLASSDAVYGDHGEQPLTEETLLNGSHPYAASKLCAELVARSYALREGMPIGVARFSNVYGGGDRHEQRLIPASILAVLRGEPPVLQSGGSGLRDYLYVEDAVDGLLQLAEYAKAQRIAGEAFNFSSERLLAVRDVVAAVLRLMGRDDLQPRSLGGPTQGGEVKRVVSGKARAVLGWAPRADFEDGLRQTIAWYRTGRWAHA